jgi:histidinol dehydrogenase
MNTADLIVALDSPAGRRRLARLAARGGTIGRDVERGVVRILADVRRRGDAALLAHTQRLDGLRTTARGLVVPPAALAAAYEAQPASVRRDLALAARRIRAFHRRQRSVSWQMRDAQGARLGVRVRPLARVGLYVPGGRAAYPSTVLMTAIPARVAGVPSLVVVSPAGPAGHHPVMLAACHVAGIDTLYRVGGAQAIAALAYGTRTIAPVDKIVGPGNAWVATAKRLVYGIAYLIFKLDIKNASFVVPRPIFQVLEWILDT